VEIPLEFFVCPVTKGKLTFYDCHCVTESGTIYERDVKHSFWKFIPKDPDLFKKEEWVIWKALQESAAVSYENDPDGNLGVGERADFLQFAEFCSFDGIVLDVGSGPQSCPTHMEYHSKADVFFIGIDPLVGEQPKRYAFAQALGEYLPFRDDLVDQVLFVTTLDHFINPEYALREAKRVVKEQGQICVWFGEKDKNAPKPPKSPEWYDKLRVPPGAEDPFHFRRFSAREFEQHVLATELQITDEATIYVDEWKRNRFYKLRK